MKAWPPRAAAIVGSTIYDPWFFIYPDAESRLCYGCGCEMWLNLTSLEVAATFSNREFVCIKCYTQYCHVPGVELVFLNEG